MDIQFLRDGDIKVVFQSHMPNMLNYLNKTSETSDDITEGAVHLFLTPTERSILNSGLSVSAAGVNGNVQFNKDDSLGANNNFYWDDVNTRLGIGKNDPATALDVVGTITTNAEGSSADWNTAYTWGDHSLIGYLTSYTETDPVFSASPSAGILSGDIINWNTAHGWGDHSIVGYLTSYTETDPVFLASDVAGVVTADITNWNTAYTWGDHSLAGYGTLSNVVEDITPQLGGQLDLNGKTISGVLDVIGTNFFLPASNAEPVDINIDNSQWTLWIDESNNEFELKAKKSNGVVISQTVGGSEVTQYDARVGAGEMYTTINSAYIDGKRDILVVGNTNETATTDISDYINIHIINNSVISMGIHNFNSADNTTVAISGNGEITYSPVSFGSYLFNSSGVGTNQKTILNDIKITMLTNTNTALFFNYGLIKCNNVWFVTGNAPNNGIDMQNTDVNSILTNCRLTGGGTNNTYAIRTNSGTIDGMSIDGLFSAGIAISLTNTTAKNIKWNADTISTIETYGIGDEYCFLSAINAINSKSVILSCGNNTKIFDSFLGIEGNFSNFGNYSEISNVRYKNTSSTTFTTCIGLTLTGCVFDTPIATISSPFIRMSGSTVTGSITITSTGDNFTGVGLTVGDVVNGTITIEAGASNTIISGSRTDIAIVDAGTNTILSGNVIF